jgi:uncharacterized protein (DUF433 family)
MDYTKIITVEPGKRGGKPCIRGMRIAVCDVLGYLAGGMTEDEILRDFPHLTREDIRACLAFGADCAAMREPHQSNEHRRVLLPVSKATGGLRPGIDLTRLSDIQEMEDLEYIERMRKGFK